MLSNKLKFYLILKYPSDLFLKNLLIWLADRSVVRAALIEMLG